MSFPAPEQLPALTAALIRLRGDTLGRIAEATGIRAANLSVWLRGKEQVISAKRLVGLLHHLDVEGNRLRSDMLHQWRDGGALVDSKTVLTTLLGRTKPWLLFQDDQPGLAKTRFLVVGDVLVRLQIEPGVGSAADLSNVIDADRLVSSPEPLAGVPTASLSAAYDTLRALAEQAALDIGDTELLDGLLFRLSEDPASNISTPRGWQRLEAALRTALAAGATPTSIAELLERHFRPESQTDSCSSARPD